MDGDRDGGYPRGQPPRERWDTRSAPRGGAGDGRTGTRPGGPPSGPAGRTRPASQAPGWGTPPTSGGVAAWGGDHGVARHDEPGWGGDPAWGPAARDASSARWESPADPAGAARLGGPVGGRRLPAFLRPPAVWFTSVAAVGSVVLVAITVLALLPSPAPRTSVAVLPPTQVTNAPLPVPTYTVGDPLPEFALPAFHDWRAAYLAADGMVRVVSLDGRTDLAGPAFPLNTADTTNSALTNGTSDTAQSITSLAISPNGQSLAYIEQAPQPSGAGFAPPSGDLILEQLGVTTTWDKMRVPGQVTNIGGWSPDSTRVAISAALDNASNIYLLNPIVPDKSGLIGHAIEPGVTVIPGFASNGALQSAHVLGWIDNARLLLMIDLNTGFAFPPLASASEAASVASVGGMPAGMTIATSAPRGANAARHALTAPLDPPRSSNPPMTLATVDITTGTGYTIATIPAGSVAALAPDGTKVVIQDGCVTPCAASPLITEIIDTRTGAVQSLPQADKAITPSAALVWNPTGSLFAATVATDQRSMADWKAAVVNTQADSAQTLRTDAFVIGWSPDGSALLVGDATHLNDPTTHSTRVWLVAPGSGATPIALPQPMVAFIGWVRTA